MNEPEEVIAARRVMRAYNLRHLVAQIGIFTVMAGFCSGVANPSTLPLVALTVVVLGLATGGLVTILVRDWRRYAEAQETLWHWDQRDSS